MGKSTKPKQGESVGLKPMGPAQLEAVAELFAMLSEPSRLAILQLLQSAPLSVGEVVAASGMKQANVSKQLGLLLSAGVIERRQDGNRAMYSIKLPLIFDLCHLVCGSMADEAAKRAAALKV